MLKGRGAGSARPDPAAVLAKIRDGRHDDAIDLVDRMLAGRGVTDAQRWKLLHLGATAVIAGRRTDRYGDADRWSEETASSPLANPEGIAQRANVLAVLQRQAEARDIASLALLRGAVGVARKSALRTRMMASVALDEPARALADVDAALAEPDLTEGARAAIEGVGASCIVWLDLRERFADADLWLARATARVEAAGQPGAVSALVAELMVLTGRFVEAEPVLLASLAELEAARAAGKPRSSHEAERHAYLARGYLDAGDPERASRHVSQAIRFGGEGVVLAGVMNRIHAASVPWPVEPEPGTTAPFAGPTGDQAAEVQEAQRRAESALAQPLQVSRRVAFQLSLAHSIAQLGQIDRYAEADQLTDAIVRSGVQFPAALEARAAVLLVTGRPAAAADLLSRALAQLDGPERRSELLEARMRAHIGAGALRAALADADALRQDESLPAGHRARATLMATLLVVLLDDGPRFDEVDRLTEAAMTATPEDPDIVEHRAAVLAVATPGRSAEALALMGEAESDQQRAGGTHTIDAGIRALVRARALADLGRPDEARPHLDHAAATGVSGPLLERTAADLGRRTPS